jgi:hypothetical protein
MRVFIFNHYTDSGYGEYWWVSVLQKNKNNTNIDKRNMNQNKIAYMNKNNAITAITKFLTIIY